MPSEVLNLETGIFYNSIREAAFAHNINESTLNYQLNGKSPLCINLIKLEIIPTVKNQIESEKSKKDKLLKQGFKKCNCCNEIKSIDNFNSHKKKLSYICKKCTNIKRKAYYELNKEKENKRSVEYNRDYRKERKKLDFKYKLEDNLRSRIGTSFRRKKWKKSSLTQKLLGCDYEFLKNYIESQFEDGMMWSNHYQYWEIDHIIPLSLAENEEELEKLHHYINLKPVIKNYNRTKKNNLTSSDIKFYHESLNNYVSKI